MTLQEVYAVLESLGFPGVLAVITALFLHLYLRSERSRMPEPEWLGEIKQAINHVAQTLDSARKDRQHRDERLTDKLDVIARDLHSINIKLETRGRRSD